MNRDLQTIKNSSLQLLEPYGVKRLGLFGSYARNEAGPKSDLDLFVEFESPRKTDLSLLGFIRLEEKLSRALGVKVDLVSAGGMSPHLRDLVEKEMIVLYEQKK